MEIQSSDGLKQWSSLCRIVPSRSHPASLYPSCLIWAATVLAIVLAKGQRTPLHFPTRIANKAQPWLSARLSESKNIVTQYQDQRVSSEKSMMGKMHICCWPCVNLKGHVLYSSKPGFMSDTDSEKIICVRSLQFADSEKFKCINYTVLVLNLCFIKKAPANSSSVVLMRWIMRYSKVTKRFFKSHLIHKRNCHITSAVNYTAEIGVSGDVLTHADMTWIIDYMFHRAVMRILWGAANSVLQWNHSVSQSDASIQWPFPLSGCSLDETAVNHHCFVFNTLAVSEIKLHIFK